MLILISALFISCSVLGLLAAGSMAAWRGTVFFNPWHFFPTLVASLMILFLGIVISR